MHYEEINKLLMIARIGVRFTTITSKIVPGGGAVLEQITIELNDGTKITFGEEDGSVPVTVDAP